MNLSNVVSYLNLPRSIQEIEKDPLSWGIVQNWLRVKGVLAGREQLELDEHNNKRALEYIAIAGLAHRIQRRLSLLFLTEVSCRPRLGTWEEDFHKGIDGYLVFGSGVIEFPVDITAYKEKLGGKDTKKVDTLTPKAERYIVYIEKDKLHGYAKQVNEVLSRRSKWGNIHDILTSIDNRDSPITRTHPYCFCNSGTVTIGPNTEIMNLLVQETGNFTKKNASTLREYFFRTPSPR